LSGHSIYLIYYNDIYYFTR